LQPQYRKVWIAELKPGGQQLSLAHLQTTASDYFGEPQASVSRDFRYAIWASNLGAGSAESYIATVPFK
jgi:hypothetical protein